MIDPMKELDEALVRQVIPNLTRIYQKVFVLRQMEEEHLLLVTHAMDMSMAGFDLSTMTNYINLAHARDGIQVLDHFDPTTFEEVCATGKTAENQTASTIHKLPLPFYHKLAEHLKWCADYIISLQARHPDLVSDFSNHLNRKPFRRLEPGDVFRSSGGYCLLVVEVLHSPDGKGATVYGHVHGDTDLSIRSESGNGEVSLVGFIPIETYWIEYNGREFGKREFPSREACLEVCKTNPSLHHKVWPMPRGRELSL